MNKAYKILILLAILLWMDVPLHAMGNTWSRLHARGSVLYEQERYAEAMHVAQKALKTAEQTFGPDHPNVALSLNSLAELYSVENKFAEAEGYYKRALLINEKALGKNDPVVAMDLNNLAIKIRIKRTQLAAKVVL